MSEVVGQAPTGHLRRGASWRLLARPAGATAALALGTALVAAHDPNRPGAFPPCLFLHATGHWCPGCGGLRAAYALLHGDFAGAMDMNPLVTLVVIPATIVGLGWWWLGALGVPVRPMRLSARGGWVMFAVVVAFWVLRNIPALEPYLAP